MQGPPYYRIRDFSERFMNRRGFMKLIAGAAAIPVIGLPKPAGEAPAIKLWPMQERMLEVMETDYVYVVGRGDRWYRYYCICYDDPVIMAELDAKMKKAMDKMVFKPPYDGPQTLTISVPAGTMMVYADDDCRIVRPA